MALEWRAGCLRPQASTSHSHRALASPQVSPGGLLGLSRAAWLHGPIREAPGSGRGHGDRGGRQDRGLQKGQSQWEGHQARLHSMHLLI